jgi:hypothetical protein
MTRTADRLDCSLARRPYLIGGVFVMMLIVGGGGLHR